MKTSYLVCYDITDPVRLNRVFRLLKGMGQHLQYSVFVCRLTYPELVSLKEQLKALIDERYDDIRIYPLPSRLQVEVIGCGDRVPEGVEIFL